MDALLLTRADAAKVLGVSMSTLRRLTDAGDIEALRVSKRLVRYSPDALQAYVRRQTNPAVVPWPSRAARSSARRGRAF